MWIALLLISIIIAIAVTAKQGGYFCGVLVLPAADIMEEEESDDEEEDADDDKHRQETEEVMKHDQLTAFLHQMELQYRK